MALFLDFKKAFDTVDHDILVIKLEKNGFRGKLLNLLKNYLINRVKFVSDGIINSTFEKITCGVPQGSVLGRLLFLIWINDISNVTKTSEKSLFADDTAIVGSGKTRAFLKEFRIDTQSLNDWCNVNKLSINTDKSKLMGFGKAMPHASISLAGENMENKDSFNYLSIEIDKKLNFYLQTIKFCTKISKFNGVLYRGRPCFSKQALIKFYIAYVIPLISYGLLAYGCTSKSNLDKIFLAQKKIIRTIFLLRKYDHVLEYFSKFQLQSVHEFFISQLFSETIFQFLEKSPLKVLNLDYVKTRRSTRSNSLGCIPLPLRKFGFVQNCEKSLNTENLTTTGETNIAIRGI